MEISVLGSGYVGTTLSACLADLGHDVTAIDIVDTINAGESPIHEPGLDELIEAHAGDALTATTEYAAVPEMDVTFLALATPSEADGVIDTSLVESAAADLGAALAERCSSVTE